MSHRTNEDPAIIAERQLLSDAAARLSRSMDAKTRQYRRRKQLQAELDAALSAPLISYKVRP